MTDIAVWLLAQVDADEAAYLTPPDHPALSAGMPLGDADLSPWPCRMDDWEMQVGAHRWMAECDAKRAIVAEHEGYDVDDMHFCSVCLNGWHPCSTLRHLAAVYADRDGWREEWRA